MKRCHKYSIVTALIVLCTVGLAGVPGTAPAYAAQATVDLGTASSFAILAGTPNITDAGGTSVIIGNVGLSPASGAGIGLLCAQVTGTIYAVDAAGLPCFAGNPPLSNKTLVDNAKLDLTAAFIDAAGRTPVTTVPTELGGTTKTAGAYDSASTTFGITAGAGPLVLDGQGDPTSVFIFEMNSGSTGLIVGPGSTVSLVNGAQACNVFWRLDTATINTTAVFKGTILALNSITVANGANIEGRLLARNGNVTLINDTITRPTCAATIASAGTTATSAVPSLPNTGVEPQPSSAWKIAIPAGIITAAAVFYVVRKKRITWSRY